MPGTSKTLVAQKGKAAEPESNTRVFFFFLFFFFALCPVHPNWGEQTLLKCGNNNTTTWLVEEHDGVEQELGVDPVRTLRLCNRSLLPPSPCLRTRVGVCVFLSLHMSSAVIFSLLEYTYTLLLRSGQCGVSLCGYDSCDIFILPRPKDIQTHTLALSQGIGDVRGMGWSSLCSRQPRNMACPSAWARWQAAATARAKRGTRSKEC